MSQAIWFLIGSSVGLFIGVFAWRFFVHVIKILEYADEMYRATGKLSPQLWLSIAERQIKEADDKLARYSCRVCGRRMIVSSDHFSHTIHQGGTTTDKRLFRSECPEGCSKEKPWIEMISP